MNDLTNIHSFPSSLNNNQPQKNIVSQTTLNIATNNVISFSDYTKRQQIINEAYLNQIDILGISETNITSKQSIFIKKEIANQYTFLYNNDTSRFNPKGSGVAILIKTKFTPYIIGHKGKNGRYLYVDFNFRRHNRIRVF